MNDDPPIDWESRYRDGATGWERPGLNPAFLSWRENGVLTPCRILLPGGGRSNEPLAMAESGFDVTVVDLAESAVAAQRGRLERLHVRARVEQANLLEWAAPAPFDAVYDQACLCAAPAQLVEPGRPSIHPVHAEPFRRGPPFHCDMPEMRRLFTPTRWHWPQQLDRAVPHSAGREEQPAVLERL